MRSHFLLCILLLPIIAQGETSPWLSCSLIQDDLARLSCYDQASNAQLPPTRSIQPIQAPEKGHLFTESGQPEINTHSTLPYTELSRLYDLNENSDAGLLSIRAHRPMYLLPYWYNQSPNQVPQSPTQGKAALYNGQAQRQEAKLQLSFKSKLAQDLFSTRADLWFGYTQISHWQVYNNSWSKPFRGTDYQPEIFLTQPLRVHLPFGGYWRMLGTGLIHHSNGQSDPLSRSWNRIYLMAGMEWGKLTVLPRIWWRIPEKIDKDNNPDINRYMGYGDLTLRYRFKHNQTLGTMVRYNPKSGKGAVRVDYTFPLRGKLKGYIQAFDGYGENLQDYNHRHRSIGIGLIFENWDGF